MSEIDDQRNARYQIIGIHESGHARVRFFRADGTHVDEDVMLPRLPQGVPATTEVYLAILEESLEARHQAV